MSFYVPFFDNSLRITTSPNGVVEILWLKTKCKNKIKMSVQQQKIANAITTFVSGKGDLKISIDWDNIQGTDFQKSVWKKMIQIPYGKTKSYGEIAKSLKKPGAARAVGTACGKNPILLAIPCHRVVGSTGLGGFSGGGLSVKRKLLSLENNNF